MQMARRRCFTNKLGRGYRGGSRIIRGENYISHSVNSAAISAALIQYLQHYLLLRSQIYSHVGKFNFHCEKIKHFHWLWTQTTKQSFFF
jgi:hypothetical protein